MIQEIWKPIPMFSRYEASNLGNLRSLNYKRTGKVKNLKPGLSPDGYLKTMILDDDRKYRSCTVHLFVIMAFKGLRPDGLEVNHIDGNKLNNNIENLEWVTRSENVLHAFRLGLEKPMRGEDNPTAKLTTKDVLEIRKFVAEARSSGKRYYGRSALAKKYGISSAYVKDIISKRRGIWSHI